MRKNSQILKDIITIISNQIGVPAESLDKSTQPSWLHSWDSLANTMIFLQIQSEFNIILDFNEYLDCETIEQLFERVVETIQSRSAT